MPDYVSLFSLLASLISKFSSWKKGLPGTCYWTNLHFEALLQDVAEPFGAFCLHCVPADVTMFRVLVMPPGVFTALACNLSCVCRIRLRRFNRV